MNDVAIKEPPSVIADMAARFGMDKRAFEATLKATVVPSNITNEQFAAFLIVAREYNLNPITKEIFAFPSKGGIQPIVSIDGWCNIINSHPQLDGIEFDDIKDEKGNITAIACKMHRKDRKHPVVAIEYMAECKKQTDTWSKWPARMLRHKALIQAARYAFGFSGIVDMDEADRMVDVTPEDNKPVVTAKGAYGTQTEMKKVWGRIKDAYLESGSDEELEAAHQKWAVDFEIIKSIDPQISDNLERIKEERSKAIAAVNRQRSDFNGDDGWVTDEAPTFDEEEIIPPTAPVTGAGAFLNRAKAMRS